MSSQAPQAQVDLRSFIRDLPDYPSPGITFRDITPLLSDPGAFAAAVHRLADLVPADTDVIAGLEARGFIFGAALAHHMGIGFVPIRKAGKLPPLCTGTRTTLSMGQRLLSCARTQFQPVRGSLSLTMCSPLEEQRRQAPR